MQTDQNTRVDPVPAAETGPARDTASGLTQDEASRRLAQYGPNSISTGKAVSPFSILLRQFRSLLILILLIAAALAAALGEMVDAIAILTIVLVNGVLDLESARRVAVAQRLIPC